MLFDEDATYLLSRDRPFKLKTSTQPPDDHLLNSLRGDTISDKTGLERAYEQGDAYAYGDTLYIAGSHTARDWFDDVTKIPAWGDLRNAERYRAAEKALKANPNIKRVVGHSSGGSIARELQKNYAGLESRTYGAPVWNPIGGDAKAERYRNWLDPISVFDRSAARSFKTNPFDSFSMTHDYGNIATKFQPTGSDNASGYMTPDGTVALTQ